MGSAVSPKLNDTKEIVTFTCEGKIEAILEDPLRPAKVHVLLDDGRKMLVQQYLDHKEEYLAQQRPPLPVCNCFEGSNSAGNRRDMPILVRPPDGTDPMTDQQTTEPGTLPIYHDQMGQWVRVFTDPKAADEWDFPLLLTDYLHAWFRKRPHLQLRFVIPFYREGKLVEFHAFYDAQSTLENA